MCLWGCIAALYTVLLNKAEKGVTLDKVYKSTTYTNNKDKLFYLIIYNNLIQNTK